jgi:hypothetical protein
LARTFRLRQGYCGQDGGQVGAFGSLFSEPQQIRETTTRARSSKSLSSHDLEQFEWFKLREDQTGDNGESFFGILKYFCEA